MKQLPPKFKYPKPPDLIRKIASLRVRLREHQEVENRPLSRKAAELLLAAKEPSVEALELSLVELLRVALDNVRVPSEVLQRAQTTLELADRLVSQKRYLSAYHAVVGYKDSRDEPAVEWANVAKTLQDGCERVVKMAAN